MYCYVYLNRISWPRKSGCLRTPSHPAVCLQGQWAPRELLSLLSWMGRGMSGRSRCFKRPMSAFCKELGLPVVCRAHVFLPWTYIQKNTDLKHWFTVTLFMVEESCEFKGKLWWFLPLESYSYGRPTLKPLFTATIKLIIYKVQEHLGRFVSLSFMVSSTIFLPTPTYSDFKKRYCYQRCVKGMLCWPSASAWRSHPWILLVCLKFIWTVVFPTHQNSVLSVYYFPREGLCTFISKCIF